MSSVSRPYRPRAAWLAFVGLAVVASVVLSAQDEFAVYVFVVDEQGVPVLDIKAEDISVREDVGESTVLGVSRVGWPLKVTVLVDTGPASADAQVHVRAGLTKFFEGLPPGVPVSLIATAPNPRWLVRESKDRAEIARAVNRITPDYDSLGRFSDALIEYARRLDNEFRRVETDQLPPYLPVLVSIATTHQDGSEVIREANERMLLSLRRHRVWTNMVMVTPSRSLTTPGELPLIEYDEGQNAAIGKLVEEVTNGRYIPVTGAGTSALSGRILPDLAQDITLRYLRQMTQHRVEFERPAGATGPMKNFSLKLSNHPGARILVSTTPNMP